MVWTKGHICLLQSGSTALDETEAGKPALNIQHQKKSSMKKKTLLTLIVVSALVSFSYAQNVYVNKMYQDTFGQPVFNPILNQFGMQWSNSILSMSGEIITVGHTTVTGQGEDILLEKRDQNGTVVFQVSYNTASANNDYGIGVYESPTGEIYVCGTTDNSNVVDHDAVILKFSSAGVLLDATAFAGPDMLNDIGMALLIHPVSNNLLVAVCSENNATSYDYTVVELDANNLSQLNVNTYDYANLIDIPLGIEVDGINGDILIIGGSQSSAVENAYAVAVFDSNTLMFLSDSRTDLIGTPNDVPTAYVKDAGGNIYITGKTLGSTSFDIKTVKLLPNYTIAWTATLDPYGMDDLGSTIACDPVTGDVIIGGYAGNSNKEMICVRYNSNGSLLSTHTQEAESSTGDAVLKKLATNSLGDVYFIGAEDANAGFKQVVVGKIKANGNKAWERKIAGSTQNVLPSDVKVHQQGCDVISVADSTGPSYLFTRYTDLETDTTRVYVGGVPKWKKRELIVSFMPGAINTAEIDNLVGSKQSEFAGLQDYLTTSAYNTVSSSLESVCRDCDIKAIKIFDSFLSTDSTDISRRGEVVPRPPFWSMLLLQFPPHASISQVAAVLNNLKDIVSYAHPNYFVTEMASPPNDSLYATQQPNLHPIGSIANAHINIEEAWNIVTDCGSSDIKCGLFDSGVEWRHKDFGYNGSPTSGKIQGWDFSWYNQFSMNLRNTTTPDAANHGTRTAGIIAGLRNNTSGVAGIAGGDGSTNNPGVSLFSIKITQTTANLLIKSQVESVRTGSLGYNYGIDFATCNYLIAQDFGYTLDTIASLREAIRYMYRMQVPIVAARGNYQNKTYYPACFDTSWVISVGGTGPDGLYQSPYSWGQGIDIAAPSNSNIVVTTSADKSYIGYNGTSAATPHAAGVVGLMLSYMNDSTNLYNNLAPEDCDFILQRSATDVGQAGYDTLTGYGRLNAGAALRMIERPYRILYHFGTNYRFPYTLNKSLYSNSDTIQLTEKYVTPDEVVHNPGKYIVKTFQIDATISHPGLYITDSLIYYWPRPSSSFVYDLPNAQKRMDMHERVKIVSLSGSSAQLRGYVYQVWDSLGNPKGWWPCDTSFALLYNGIKAPNTFMEYSVLTKNKAVGIYKNALEDQIVRVL